MRISDNVGKRNIAVALVLCIILVCVIAYKFTVDYYHSPISIKLTEIARVHTEQKITGIYWSTGKQIKNEYNITLPKVDESKYMLIASPGRKIKQFYYIRASKKQYTDIDAYVAKAVFGRDFNNNTIYIYKTNKINIIDDLAAGIPYELRIEGEPTKILNN